MQTYLSLYFLTLAAVSFGLLLASLPYLGGKIEGRAHPLWALSLAMFASSLGLFAWLVPQMTQLDDDLDGWVDCEDYSCAGRYECAEFQCNDLADNDGDGLVDCEDGDCVGDFYCTL